MEQARVPERYTLIEEVGQGGMAVVYRAQDETLKREVAIKILHQHLAGEPDSKARLEREAQAVAKLRHENILEIFDYSGLGSASSYIVTEFIDGQTLKQYLNGRPLGFSEVAALIAVEVCHALAHAHSLGVIHRDVKPENVMIRKDGLIKLMDFGIAQVLDFQRMTVTGQLLGSPAYMAPEIIEGKQLDFRTDVFSVGIMLYLLATGELPFSGRNPHEVLRRIAEGKFADPRTVGRGVDQVLARIITRALAHRPDDRYPDVAPMCDDLTAYLAEAGLTDVRAELRAYFADPAAYDQALPKRLAAALTESARDAARGRAPREGDGAVEPGPRLRPGQRDGERGAAASAGAPAVAPGHGGAPRWSPSLRAVSWAAAHHRRSHPSPAAAAVVLPAVAQLTPPRRAGAGPGDAQTATAAAPRAAAAARLGRRPSGAFARATATPPPGRPAGASRTFTLGPTPQNVDVYLDGKRQFAYDAGPHDDRRPLERRPRARAAQPQRLLLRRAGGDRARSPAAVRCDHRAPPQVAPGAPSGHDRAGRRRRRGCWCSDPNRKVAATAGRPGEEIDVPFFADDDSSKEIEVAVDAGEAFATEKIRVRAGERLTHVVKLKTGATPNEHRTLGRAGGRAPRRDPCAPAGGRGPRRTRPSIAGGRPSGGQSTSAPSRSLHPLLYPEVLLDSEGEVVQAHRMLGVSYLFSGQSEEAKREFHKLLELRPDYRFDPLLDPQQVVDAFNAVVKEEETEIVSIEARRKRRDQEIAARLQREARLHPPTTTIVRYERHSYLLNFVPFGAGQFQNGQRRKGWLFFGVETALAAISVGAFTANFALYGANPYRKCLRSRGSTGACPTDRDRSLAGGHLPDAPPRPGHLRRAVLRGGDLGRDRRRPALPARRADDRTGVAPPPPAVQVGLTPFGLSAALSF